MSVNIDIRGHLRHPVFDPDYKRPQAKLRLISNNQKAETPSRDNHVTSVSSYSSSMSETDTSDDDSWRGRRQTMKTSPTSATVTTTDIKAVTFGDNVRKERGRTAAGKDTSSGGRTVGRSGDGGDTNRLGWSKKKTKIRKWRSLSDADSQPIGIKTRQHQRERETAELQPKNCSTAAKNGRTPESKQTDHVHMTRPSSFTRFKYPVKFHRSVGETSNTALRGLITSKFDIPDCMRRPSSISWLPVRQGSVVDRGRSNSRAEANRTDSHKSTTAMKSTHRSSTKMETQDSDRPPPSSEELELNGVYHVVHAEHSRSGLRGGHKTGKIDPESRRDSDPDTAISSHVASLSLESNASTSSESEQDDDGHNSERGRPSSDAGDDQNVNIKNNRSKKTMARSSRDDNACSDNNASSDNEAYSDDFVE